MESSTRTEGENKMDNQQPNNESIFAYQLKKSFITETERKYLSAIKPLLPQGYYLQPQVNLATVIEKIGEFKYQNELYRNVDACIFDEEDKPIALIEINDETHNQPDRIKRDRKVKCICEEAGIPLVRFWTSYGVNTDYIQKRIIEAIEQAKNPIRIPHSQNKKATNQNEGDTNKQPLKQSSGCYVATCVYGSYDCPQVWTLRRYRDYSLAKTWHGRTFIHMYYAISPTMVKWFGKRNWFKNLFKNKLDKKVSKLQSKGYDNNSYEDKNC